MSAGDLTGSTARRKILFAAVSSACYEAGYHAAEKAGLETLTEMLQSFLAEIGRSSRSFCELAGRTDAVIGDVVVALVEMGFNLDSLAAFSKRPNRITLPTPASVPRSTISKILQAGEKRSLPNYVPDNYPPFPDPHAYIKTPTHRQPVTEYEAIREKAASQKRDVERALTRFIAKTGSTQSLYPDDITLFPLIACKPSPHPHLNALLFSDQIFDEDGKENVSKSQTAPYGDENAIPKENIQDGDVMDNPYLRPAKIQRKRRK